MRLLSIVTNITRKIQSVIDSFVAVCFHHTKQIKHVVELLSEHTNIDPEYKYQLLMVKELRILGNKLLLNS